MCRTCMMLAFLALVLASAPLASAQTNLGRHVTIDVTEVAPQKVFELLASALECTISVDPAMKKPLTLQVVDMQAADILSVICQNIN